MRIAGILLGSCLVLTACDLQWRLKVDGNESSESERTDDKTDATKDQPPGEREREVEEVEVEVEVEVETLRTVCEDLDFHITKIVKVPPNPPFHSEPIERVTLRITNHGGQAARLRGATHATFLDEHRAVVHSDAHASDWFMSRTVPAHASVDVRIVVPEHGGKALRYVEAEANPQDDPFADCMVKDDLLKARVAKPEAPAAPETPAEPEAPEGAEEPGAPVGPEVPTEPGPITEL